MTSFIIQIQNRFSELGDLKKKENTKNSQIAHEQTDLCFR